MNIESIQNHSFIVYIDKHITQIIIPISFIMFSIAFVFNNFLLASNALLIILATILYEKNKELNRILNLIKEYGENKQNE